MISEHRFIRMSDGLELHAEIKEIGAPIWLIATHGLGEHLGRHAYLSELLGSHYNLFQYDLRGHGRSMGEKAYLANFWNYMEDLEQIVQYLRTNYRMKRYVLFAHSMGALITAGYIQKYLKKDFFPECVFLNAPPVGFPGIAGDVLRLTPLQIKGLLAEIPLSMRLGGLVDLDCLSHDVLVKENYLKDNLNSLKVHTKLLFELVKASAQIFSKPLKVKCPAYVTVGSEDRVVGVGDLTHYFSKVEKNFKLKIFHGAYHEIHNEIEKYRKPYFNYLKEKIIKERFA